MNILVNCKGFIGDCLFASSLAKKLKEKYPGCEVHYNIPLVQPYDILKRNPHIDYVVVNNNFGRRPEQFFDLIINIPEADFRFPTPAYFQAQAGIENQSTEFDAYTVPEYDEEAELLIGQIRENHPGKKIIAWQKNWEYRAYQCTPDSIRQRVGMPHRNIDKIILQLEKDYILIPMGFDRHVNQYDPICSVESYSKMASIMKLCDFMIGSEGGLTNLACALHVRCIITSCFVAQLYWYNGHVKQIDNPQMGPAYYYPDHMHSQLSPFLTDNEVYNEVNAIIRGDTNGYVFNWNDREGNQPETWIKN